MKEINCNIVKDILPLYVDDVVCDDTKIMIEEHLEHCEDCKKELEKLTQNVVLPVSPEAQLQEAQPLKEFKKRISRKKLIIAFTSILITTVLLVGGWYVLFRYGLPASTDDAIARINFEPDEAGYLGQRWAIYFTPNKNRALQGKAEYIYKHNSAGEQVECGIKLYVYKLPFTKTNIDPDVGGIGEFGICYSYDENSAPEEDFDYVVHIIYKDKTYTYSMREEGLFEKQELHEKYERIQK